MGSANLTGRGARGNVELLATARGPADHPFFQDIADWLDEIRSFALAPTPELLEAVGKAYRAAAPLRAALAGAAAPLAAALVEESPATTAYQSTGEFWRRFHDDALVHHIQTTRIFASYKLVILAMLLRAARGRLTLAECARRFHAFYLGLESAGVQPERRSGSPPPRMLTPARYDQDDVMRLLLDAPREAFQNSGSVVSFGDGPIGPAVAIARSFWGATTTAGREVAYRAAVERLEEYYREHAGTSRGVAAVLAAATGESRPAGRG